MAENTNFNYNTINTVSTGGANYSSVSVSARTFSGIAVGGLFGMLDVNTQDVQAKLVEIKARQSAVSIGDMFEMQMLMNHLAQLSEMAGSVVSAMNQSTVSFAQKIKG
jgi:hypothetical protein